jgi:FkbM family methyltransferase
VYFHRDDTAVSHALRADSTYEPFELELIARFLRPGDCAVDVGANIGLHTLAMSSACGPNGRVLAVEPDPRNLRVCRRNLKINGRHNVEVLPVAASDRTGTIKLYLSKDNRGDHRVYDPGDHRQTLNVTAIPLTEVLADRDLQPRLVKIDVQGWESNVLAGALLALRGQQPLVLITEFWTDGLVAAGSSASEYLSLIDELQLDLYEIDAWQGSIGPVPLDRATLLNAGRDTNLLGLRGVPLGSLADVLDASRR